MENIVLNNRYIIEKKISQGGFCDIFLGRDIYDNYFNNFSKVVIKVPTKELLQKEDIDAFMYAEYSILKKLSSKNIVKVFDFGIDPQKVIPYIVMEYLDGKLLNDISISDLSLKDKYIIFKELIKTLKYLYKNNIVHCDISPYNIYIFEDDLILFDFGISKDLSNNTISFNRENYIAMNKKYSSPNIIKDKVNFDFDIYSVSIIIYEFIIGSSLNKDEIENLQKKEFKSYFFKTIKFILSILIKRN
ncbi:MAG: serine/threonine-protein kinase [Arcobacter sp.]|jgi:serine/threonine protein kinase|uniref:Serine/threonine-protein kinase n=1 Tax=Arcobacter defluvii TaxID=873191 RepID=A0AAE7BI46_9BACT|nr:MULTISPECIES: serine/threonine-protein kinase [Arcobacter]QKF78257.1 serine/threonine-protein kinase [Arcobacter defluvii]RXI29064.1 serine/threonine protein kinase [Arcobacter defluvii]BAK74053.1 protein kinase [Arcobacter sp. L]